MRVTRVIADIPVSDIDGARSFYADYLGLSDEEFNLGWVARFTSPETGANVQILTRDETAPEVPVASVMVDDVEAAFRDAVQRGYEIVHPLSSEAWGVTRFFLRAPDGNVFNIVRERSSTSSGNGPSRGLPDGVRLPSLTVDTVIGFASPEDRAAFTAELQSAIAALAARYHHDDGRPHRLTVSSYPRPKEAS